MPLVPGMGPGMVPAKAQLPQTPLAPLTPAAALARSSESMSAPLASSSGDRGWSSNDLSNDQEKVVQRSFQLSFFNMTKCLLSWIATSF